MCFVHPSGLHGYSHENPVSMTVEQQKDILDHTYDLLTKFNNGVPPKGSVAPWWETSKEGTMLLLDKGIEYGMHLAMFLCERACLTKRAG